MSHESKSKRSRQVSDLIHRDLAFILRREINDNRLNQISITEVNVSPDLRNARVYYTLLDDSQLEEVKKALTKGTGFLRHALADKITLRYVPKLEFVYDKNLEQAEQLSSLINKLDINDDEK